MGRVTYGASTSGKLADLDLIVKREGFRDLNHFLEVKAKYIDNINFIGE